MNKRNGNGAGRFQVMQNNLETGVSIMTATSATQQGADKVAGRLNKHGGKIYKYTVIDTAK